MKKTAIGYVLAAFIGIGFSALAIAENAPAENAPSAIQQVKDKVGQMASTAMQKTEEVKKQAQAKLNEVAGKAQAKLNEVADKVEHSEQAKKLTAGILQPIYWLSQKMAFPEFYWLAFALMVAGVVSWIGQLVIAKLVVASAGGFSITEIISDATVLIISLVGLVLTTQAATQNSTFTQSSVMVLSSAAVGLIFGIMLYFWGQAQEVEAAKTRGRK